MIRVRSTSFVVGDAAYKRHLLELTQMLRLLVTVLVFLAAPGVSAQPALLLVSVPESEVIQVSVSPESVVAKYADKNTNAISAADAFCGLHLMLDGEPWTPSSAVGYALMGGRPIGAQTRRSGPILLLSPPQVADTSLALSPVGKQDLKRRYEPDRINQLCMPTKASLVSDAEELTEFLRYLEPLQGFYAKAAKRGDAVLLLLWFGPLPER